MMNNSNEYKQLKTLAECKGANTDLGKYIKDLQNLSLNIEEDESFTKVIKACKALSDRNRLIIFKLLLEKEEMCICEFSFALKKSQPTISHHIQKLEEANIIEGIKNGKFIHYRIKKQSVQTIFHQLGDILEII